MNADEVASLDSKALFLGVADHANKRSSTTTGSDVHARCGEDSVYSDREGLSLGLASCAVSHAKSPQPEDRYRGRLWDLATIDRWSSSQNRSIQLIFVGR